MKLVKKIAAAAAALSVFLSSALCMPVYALEPIPPEAETDVGVESGPALLDGLMDTFRPTDKNYMYSPFSIKTALALAANGGDEYTAGELLKVIGTENIDEYNERALALAEKYSGDSDVVLKSANSIWINKDKAPNTTFLPDYTALVKKFYNAETGIVDTENALETINGWCSESTNGRIEKIIDDASFSAAIANALYFKGDWERPFPEHYTFKNLFTDRNGKKARIDFMHNDANRPNGFYEDEDVKILELDYKGRETAMYLVLDQKDDGVIRHTDITRYMDKMQSRYVEVSIPKFEIEYENEYPFPQDFKYSANFGKMFSGKDDILPEKLVHKTFISVDEYGTEAAAATVMTMEGMAPDIPTFTADRPFEFFIADKASKEVLFAGEYAYADPEDYVADSLGPDVMNAEFMPMWYMDGIAVWNPAINDILDTDSCEYVIRLYKDGRSAGEIKKVYRRTAEDEDVISITDEPKLGIADLRELIKRSGEGLYTFEVVYEYKDDGVYTKKAESIPMFCAGTDDTAYDQSVFSKTSDTFFAASGKVTVSGLYQCDYVLSDPEAAQILYDRTFYSSEYLDGMVGFPTYRQYVFKPLKPGVVTLKLIYSEIRPVIASSETAQGSDGRFVSGTDEYTYVIDTDLKVHVYAASPECLAGDADNDGHLTAADSAYTLQKALVSTFKTPAETDTPVPVVLKDNVLYSRTAVMDINKNGEIDADDSARILQTVLTGKK